MGFDRKFFHLFCITYTFQTTTSALVKQAEAVLTNNVLIESGNVF